MTSPSTPPTPLRTRARSLEQRLTSVALTRLPLKLAAVFFALVLWLAVSAEEPTEEWVDVRVALIHDSNVTLLDSTPPVQALVVGRGRDLLKLYTTLPVLRRLVTPDSGGRFTLTLRPTDVDLPSNVDARVRDVRPASLAMRVAIAETRRVPVRLAVEVTADSSFRILGTPTVDPDSVTVRGARDPVRKLVAVYTEQRPLSVHDTITDVVVPIDTVGLHVRVMPAQVRIHIAAAHNAPPPAELDSAGQAPAARKPPR